MEENERFYYKVGNSYVSLKEQLEPLPENYVEITEEQYIEEVNALLKPKYLEE